MNKATAGQFTDKRFGTAADKAKFVNQLLAFAESGFDEKKFHNTVYTRLMNLFGHIAHYSKVGFYDEWFSSDLQRLRWLMHIAKAEVYDVTDWADAERYIQNYLASSGLAHTYRLRVSNQIESREREELAKLKAKYEENRPC
jgi:hypothetical protein